MSLRLRLAALLTLLFAALAAPAQAEVMAHFHSFNGSVLFGRYPHTFVVFEGTLDETGERIEENFGFSAKSVGPSVLTGPVEHIIMTEKPKWITRTNRHFSIPLTDEQYRRLRREVFAWRDQPGKYYDLDTRNCIHFVGRLAQLAGLRVDYPKDMLRRPKAWLNHVTALNPKLGVAPVD
jgi:hypothetical protein